MLSYRQTPRKHLISTSNIRLGTDYNFYSWGRWRSRAFVPFLHSKTSHPPVQWNSQLYLSLFPSDPSHEHGIPLDGGPDHPNRPHHHPPSVFRSGECADQNRTLPNGMLPGQPHLRTRQPTADDHQHVNRTHPQGRRFPRLLGRHSTIIRPTHPPIPSGWHRTCARSLQFAHNHPLQPIRLPVLEASHPAVPAAAGQRHRLSQCHTDHSGAGKRDQFVVLFNDLLSYQRVKFFTNHQHRISRYHYITHRFHGYTPDLLRIRR